MPPLPKGKVMLPLSKALHELPLRGSWRTKCDGEGFLFPLDTYLTK